jgi:hypothetical protein
MIEDVEKLFVDMSQTYSIVPVPPVGNESLVIKAGSKDPQFVSSQQILPG